jgi:hypothetical protein
MVQVIKSRRMRWVGNVARMGERGGLYRDLDGKPEGKIPLGRPRRRWKVNVKIVITVEPATSIVTVEEN